jgi:hypothetical protein
MTALKVNQSKMSGMVSVLLADFKVSVDLNGVVVFAYPELLRHFGGVISNGENILKKFTETDLGDAVVDAGHVIPIVNIDDGDYLIRVYMDRAPVANSREVVFSDPGYVLDVQRDLYVADAAVFWDWEELLGWHKIPVSPGLYSVTVQGVRHRAANDQVDAAGYDLILERVDQLPRRAAVVRSDSRVK